MKKAMIITSVLLVVSFIATLCFGVALGSQGLRALFRDGGVLDRYVSDRADISMYTNGDHDEEDRRNLFQSDSATLDATDTLSITAEAGNVYIRPATSNTVEVVLEQYSRRSNPTSRYTLETANGEIRVLAEDDLEGVEAVLTVYVPGTLTTLWAETLLGKLQITGITASALSAHVDMGSLEVERVTADTAQLRVETGELDVDGSVAVTQSLTAETVTGDVNLELPVSTPFALTYTVDTGSAELDEDIPTAWLREVQRSGTGAAGTLQRDTGGAQYTVHVALGNLELDRGD